MGRKELSPKHADFIPADPIMQAPWGRTADMDAIINSAKAKAAMQVAIAKGQSTAKTAKVPEKTVGALAKQEATKAKAAEKAEEANAKWERPNLNALCRKLAGGDVFAGMFLFHIIYEFKNRKHKLDRHGREWLAHKRAAWAFASGMSDAEFEKRALPRIRQYCHSFLTIRAMGHGKAKQLWISLDWSALQDETSLHDPDTWEMFKAAINHAGPGNEKKPTNYYHKDPE